MRIDLVILTLRYFSYDFGLISPFLSSSIYDIYKYDACYIDMDIDMDMDRLDIEGDRKTERRGGACLVEAGPLQEEYILLTTEPSLQQQFLYAINIYFLT